VSKLSEFISHCDNVGLMLKEMADTSVIKWLKASEGISEEDSSNGKLDDLETVIEIASGYTSIDEFLAYVDDMIQAAEAAKNDDWSEYVVISTYHRLKGLERPVVFCMGVCEGEDINGNPVGLLPHTFSLRPPPNFGVLPGSGQSPIEDEICVFFVGMSRAKDKCYVTGTRRYRDWELRESRFIAMAGIKYGDMPEKKVQNHGT
jgi:superfamily I DNA/RNA helicase